MLFEIIKISAQKQLVMEYTKNSLFKYSLLIFFFTLSCVSNNKSETKNTIDINENSSKEEYQDSVKCKNNPLLYTEIVKDLLYKDAISNIYLKRKQQNMGSPLGGELTECEKSPYAYLNQVGTLNDSIGLIKDIVNIDSFKRIENTDTYFTDNTNVYVYRDNPVGYPPFYEIDINPKQSKVIDSSYIKDESRVYWKGIKVKDADYKSFESSVFRSKNGKEFNLVHDKNHIYFYDKPYTLERFNNLPLKESILDSLKNVFFKK